MSDQQLKDLLEHLVDPVQDMDDAVPASLVRGRRSVRRRRIALSGLGVVAVVAVIAGTIGLAGLVGSGEEGFAGPPAASPWQEPPVSAEQRQFQGRVAAELDRLLPARFGKVTADSEFEHYRAPASGESFPIVFTVGKPQGDRPVACVKGSSMRSCVAGAVQPGNVPVIAYHGVAKDNEGRTSAIPTARMLYQGNEVELTVFPVFTAGASVPISDEEMMTVVTAPRFLDLVDEWMSHPDWMPEGSTPGTPAR